ncbi:hypothetical protein K2D_19460 [Planctomycetes bacterium K2D]|nr:hypothetical protein K2D_19460 [Planctomycetes bacterium K2D]
MGSSCLRKGELRDDPPWAIPIPQWGILALDLRYADYIIPFIIIGAAS